MTWGNTSAIIVNEEANITQVQNTCSKILN